MSAASALALAYAAGIRHARHSPHGTDPATSLNRRAQSASTTNSPLGERILMLLRENGPTRLAELRKELPDVRGSSVSDALTELRGKDRVEPASRGVWQLPAKPRTATEHPHGSCPYGPAAPRRGCGRCHGRTTLPAPRFLE
ncbi:hypothetical protein ACU686_12655 [Yinghuangia aomiensis]